MKANDIQIGDWLYSIIDRYDHVEKKLCKVTGIRTDSDTPLIQCDDTDVWYPLDSYEPVPLTPEILEKNGWKHEFDKTDYMVKYDLGNEGKDCWMMWAIKEHNLDIQRQDENLDMYNLKVSRVVTPCDYVHQLQHALRLCGIEKEIEL